MRFDAAGLFWTDVTTARGRNITRVMPPIPDTGWLPPTEFPNLSRASVISIDTEAYDPEIGDNGPGWARGKGHIAGVSIGADGDGRWYFPMRHEIEADQNLDPEHVLAWLRDTLGNPSQPKVGANLIYDYGWLRQEGIHLAGELVDVQFAEALLSETAPLALEELGAKYLGEGKVGEVLYRWCADFYGGRANHSQAANCYRAPPRLVGPYAIGDVDLPLRIIKHQYPQLERQGLLDVFRMECELIPLLVDMRFAGVSVDIPQAERVRDELQKEEIVLTNQLRVAVGFEVNVNASESLAKAFDAVGIPYGRTDPSKNNPDGRPSFTKDFLKEVEHPVADLVRQIREVQKTRSTFIESYILQSHVNGKVYGSIHPLRGEAYGTRSGRFAYANPNMQNLPIRHERLGPLVRSIYRPDTGHVAWRKYDYSQIEYRFLAHYAVGLGSDELRRTYCENPDTDYHEEVRQMIARATTTVLDRRPTKNLNFGMVYGMGKDKLQHDLMVYGAGKLSKPDAIKLFEAYHTGAPFVKATMEACVSEVNRYGYITTILGRRSRFDLWEPDGWNRRGLPLPYDLALMKYGRIRRSMTHKALNRRLQGSAADLMKVAMLRCWKEGVFSYTGVPRITVHDELDFSDPGGQDEAYEYMKRVMEEAIPLRVPVQVGLDIGPHWGAVG